MIHVRFKRINLLLLLLLLLIYFFLKLPKLALLAFLCNFKWKLIGNSCQPNDFEYKYRFVKGLLS